LPVIGLWPQPVIRSIAESTSVKRNSGYNPRHRQLFPQRRRRSRPEAKSAQVFLIECKYETEIPKYSTAARTSRAKKKTIASIIEKEEGHMLNIKYFLFNPIYKIQVSKDKALGDLFVRIPY
jgi:hypothetical protein